MNELGFDVVGVLVCLVLSALYSGSETALTALGAHGGHRLLEDDPKTNRLLRLWVDHPYRALTAILVGNNLVNITATALMTDLAMELVGGQRAGVAVAIGIMTFLILTFGEITPKILSRAFSTRLAVPAIRFVAFSFYVFWPVTMFFVRMAKAGLRVTGQDLVDTHPVTEDEIQFMVNLGKREGSLTGDKERLLHSVFEFSETIVKEVMVPRVEVVAVERAVRFQELLQTLTECGHSRIPVYEETIDHILGMFYAKDLLKYLLGEASPDSFDITELMREPVFVPTSKKVDALLAEFQQRRIHIAIAVDEFGGTAGVVTLEDIIEEFFGDIQDEFDREEPMLQIDEQGHTLADARIGLDELSEALDLEFPDDHDYESLGGFVSEQLGSVPIPGSTLEFGDYRFTVVDSEPTHVISVRIEPSTGAHESIDDEESDEHNTPTAKTASV